MVNAQTQEKTRMGESTAIVSATALQTMIDTMKREAGAVVVKDANDYAAVGSFLVRLRNVKKQVGFLLDPGIQSAQAHVNELRENKARYVRQIDEIDALASRPAEDWKRAEREAAAVEERRLNEQRRKEAEEKANEERRLREAEIKKAQRAGDVGKREADRLRKEADQEADAARNVPDVKVQPNVPTISGIRARVNWRFRIVDAKKIPREFLVPDEAAIGRLVRQTKDKVTAEAACPGIECWAEDAI
jgi:hypothetical protein